MFARTVIRRYCQRAEQANKLPKSIEIVPPQQGNTGVGGGGGKQQNRRVRGFIRDKFLRFVSGYESVLEKRFPRFFKVYQIFSVGTKVLLKDVAQYVRMSTDVKLGADIRKFSYRDLVVYYDTPKALVKVAPTLLLSALPFANYVIFPVAYWFPKQLLCHQFWSLQQKIDFHLDYHTKRLYKYRPVFRHLQSNSKYVEDERLRLNLETVYGKLGSGVHPTTDEVLGVKTAFAKEPYGLSFLRSSHLKELCRIHGLNAFPGKASRLWSLADNIRELDLAMIRDGGPDKLNMTELRNACFLRGLNPLNLHSEELIAWLNEWLEISKHIDDSSFSLLLHNPIFLSYNHPNNWKLIYKTGGNQ